MAETESRRPLEEIVCPVSFADTLVRLLPGGLFALAVLRVDTGALLSRWPLVSFAVTRGRNPNAHREKERERERKREGGKGEQLGRKRIEEAGCLLATVTC